MDTYLILLFIILLYTLYYTFKNDMGMFLFIILILITLICIYNFINNEINTYKNKLEKLEGTFYSFFNTIIKYTLVIKWNN